MLRNYVGPSNHRHPPGRSARRQERSFAPGPSPALARRKTPHFAGPRPQSARPYQGSRKRRPSSLAPPFSSCRRVQHSCGSARCQRSCVGTSPPHHLRHRSSKVEFNQAAIPPGLASLRLRKCQVAFVQQSCPATSPLSCLQLAKPSGRPGHSRPGCWRRGCRPATAQCGRQDCQPCLHASHAARHPLRRSARINGVG